MVTFRLIHKSDKEIKYEYFPEGNASSTAGIIAIDLEKEEITVFQPAELDTLMTITADSLIAMRKSINEMRAELGEALITEEELPTATEDNSYYCYASKAVKKITEEYNKGNILDNGCVLWY